MHTSKLVVVGLGHVGSQVLADAMKLNLFGEIATIDSREQAAYGEALDQTHATGQLSIANVHVHAGDYADCADADVVIVAAGMEQVPDPDKPGERLDRTELARDNCDAMRHIMAGISAHTREAIVIVITNPLDTTTWVAENEFGYPAGRVFGTGTMLDSARLRQIVAARYGIDPKSVTGFGIGEHGEAFVPVCSKVNVAGVPYAQLGQVLGGPEPLSSAELKEATVVTAFDVFHAKGWTNAGVAQAAVLLARAVMLDERSVYPVASTMRGEYGYDGVAFSTPTVIGRAGVLRRLEVDLDAWERAELESAVASIRATMRAGGCALEGA